MKSDHAQRNANSDTVTIELRLTGSTTERNVRQADAPSILAAWMSSLGIAGHEGGEDEHAERNGDRRVGQDQPGHGIQNPQLR